MRYSYDYPHPAVTTDIVIFTIRNQALQVLLIRRGIEPFEGSWALPGGFLRLDESLEDCAKRELEEETGVSDLYLEQLYTFGDLGRDPRERVITVAYFALVPHERCSFRPGTDADAVGWFEFDRLPQLAFDHQEILVAARERLAAKLSYSTIAFQLLPREFTLGDLQEVYETILGKPQDKRNFRKWVMGLGRVEASGSKRVAGAHRPAQLYRLKGRNTVDIVR